MTTFNSVSDLARSYQLRLGQAGLKSRLDALSKETTTGVKSDIPRALNGNLANITAIEGRLTMLEAFSRNMAEAESLLSSMQTALSQLQSSSSRNGTLLLSGALTSSDTSLMINVRQAAADFEGAVSVLNTSVGGRSAFSGSRTDGPALSSPDEIMDQISAFVGPATTTADILSAINSYFDAPVGSGGYMDAGYRGADGGVNSVAISADRTVSTDLTAASSELRDTLKGLAIMAYASRTAPLATQTVRELSQAAGALLVNGEAGITAAQAHVGVQQGLLATTRTTSGAETSSLNIARNGLVSADPYESSVALKEVEANIETVYALTARLSKLTLLDYL
jgi:flagellar hook-associated protein 3 FlgL